MLADPKSMYTTIQKSGEEHVDYLLRLMVFIFL